MDLIYTNAEHVEQGDFRSIGYTLDLAYGYEENDFELKVDSANHILDDDYLIYISGTEYGGIVDSVKTEPDESETIITYSGRTWHGILEGKVTGKNDVIYGAANTVLGELIAQYDLDDLFEAETIISTDYDSEITAFTMPAYTGLYTAIRQMLASVDLKLCMSWNGSKVKLYAAQVYDYSADEEWDSDVLDFDSQVNYNLANHFVISCDPDDGTASYVLHLYTDENGGLQPYATTDTPVQDSDYILDNRNQLLTGIDEIAMNVPMTSSNEVQNYILQSEQPADWAKNFESYFQYQEPETEGEEGSFVAVQANTIETYPVVTSEPADWADTYSNYYVYEYGEYRSVEGIEHTTYSVIGSAKPADWDINYNNYYYLFWDGTKYIYNSVDGVTKTWYKRQTAKPSDWAKNYGSYYNYVKKYKNAKKKTGAYWKYETVSSTKKGKAPSWKSRRRFTQYQTTTVPSFKASYYRANTTTTAPSFAAKVRYQQADTPITPAWKSNTYYTQVLDHYAGMVEEGQKQIETVYTADNIEATLNADETETYDIGDIVGATDNITGMFVYQPISKKIVSIENEIVSIEYKVGEEQS